MQFGLAHLSKEQIWSSLYTYALARTKAQWGRLPSPLTQKKCHSRWFSPGITLRFTGVSQLYHMWKLVCSNPDYLGETVVTRECQVYGFPLLCLITWSAWSRYSWSRFFCLLNYMMISDTCMLCYWPLVKGSIVLLVSTLWVVQRLGRRIVGIGTGREVCRQKGPMFSALI